MGRTHSLLVSYYRANSLWPIFRSMIPGSRLSSPFIRTSPEQRSLYIYVERARRCVYTHNPFKTARIVWYIRFMQNPFGNFRLVIPLVRSEKRSNEQMTPNSVKLYIYILCVFEIGVEIQLRRCLVMTTCAEYAAGGVSALSCFRSIVN